MTDQQVRDALARLSTPAEAPDFFDALWLKAEQQERNAARRWRRASIALATVVLAAATAAGVLAFGRTGSSNVVDQRFACKVAAGFGFFDNITVAHSALTLWLASPILEAPDWHHKGRIWAGKPICVSTSRPISFAADGLGPPNVLSATGAFAQRGITDRVDCRASSFLIRIRETFEVSGESTAMVAAIRSARTNRLIALLRWSPPRLTEVLGSVCTRQ